MRTDLLQALQIFTQLAVHAVCQDLRVLAIDNVTLAIEEPGGDFILSRILDDGDNAFKLFGGDFTSSGDGNQPSAMMLKQLDGLARLRLLGGIPLIQVHIGFFANQVGITASNALDLGEGVHDLLLAIDVGVEETEDELEVRLLPRDESCNSRQRISAM